MTIHYSLEEPSEDIHYQRKHQADDYHGSNRKVETEVFPFDADVAWQMPHPVQFIVEEIDQCADHNDNDAKVDDVPAGILIHEGKLQTLIYV